MLRRRSLEYFFILIFIIIYASVDDSKALLAKLKKPQYDSNNRVIEFPQTKNAQLVRKSEFKSFVGVYKDDDKIMCGGILLDVDFVLTTASCVAGNENLSVHNEAANAKDADRKVERVFIHPRFDAQTMQNDIAILNISPYAEVSERLTAINVQNGQNCTIYGWGQNNNGEFLFKTNAQVRSKEECNEVYDSLSDGMMCVKTLNSCLEDSGSTLLCNGEVAGLLSAGFGCKNDAKPNIFTDITKYNDWIDEVFRTVIENESVANKEIIETTPSSSKWTTEGSTQRINNRVPSTTKVPYSPQSSTYPQQPTGVSPNLDFPQPFSPYPQNDPGAGFYPGYPQGPNFPSSPQQPSYPSQFAGYPASGNPGYPASQDVGYPGQQNPGYPGVQSFGYPQAQNPQE